MEVTEVVGKKCSLKEFPEKVFVVHDVYQNEQNEFMLDLISPSGEYDTYMNDPVQESWEVFCKEYNLLP